VNVIPRENPNRYAKAPPPYCYHPELYPERAINNPAPIEWKKKIVAADKVPKISYYSVISDSKYSKSL
jgi:hypothetical protein